MKWILILLILSVVVIYACKPTTTVTKETAQPTTKVEETTTSGSTDNKVMSIYAQLKGDWVMYKEICCGRKNQERTGKDMQFAKRLLFSDDKNVVIVDLKTQQKKKTTYKIETKDNGNGTATTYIHLESAKGILRFEKGGLVIDYGYMDLQKEFYRKNR